MRNQETLIIDGSSLTLADLSKFLRGPGPLVQLSAAAVAGIRSSRDYVEKIVQEEQLVYGITTGFGKLANKRIASDQLAALQRNLILSHAVGVGENLDDGTVRLAILLRANALSRGNSGIRLEVIQLLLDLLNKDILPIIPAQGSVGASGDLAPLAHMALTLIGEAEVRYLDEVLPARETMENAGLKPVVLQAKEGLALINGTQISNAIGSTALLRAKDLASLADAACAYSLEALQGSLRPFDQRVNDLRPHPGHRDTAQNVRAMMEDSAILQAHRDCSKVQDQYSLRCVPQVHGAIRDAFRHLEEIIAREINSVTDNPLIFAADEDVISAGNFHAEPLAIPFDYAAAAAAELASISERRLETMINPDLSGLPAFLVEDSGLNSGFMIAQVTAAALVSENKSLAHPASIDSIPTSANKEDHVSMAPIAARKFAQILEHTAHVLAIEIMASFHGLNYGDGTKPGRGVLAMQQVISKHIQPLREDRYLKPDMDAMKRLVDDGSLLSSIRSVIPAFI